MEELIGDAKKIRKRGGCSPSSSTSSVLQNYRFKRAILATKKKTSNNGGSSTPMPTWRMVGTRSPSVIVRAATAAASSPRYPPSLPGRGKGQAPVSARKLGAALWEMNEVPTPRVVVVEDDDGGDEGLMEKRVFERRNHLRKSLNNNSGFLPSHLSDPSHSPVSERMERSGTGSHRRRESSLSRRLKTDHFDTVSNASFMEIETRSRCQTPSGSIVGGKSRLKDVSYALITSKELLKIISRMWGQEDQPSSRMSLTSALHSELERARLQINQLIQDERSDNKEFGHLLKRFAEEKAAWKIKERELVEAAVESIAVELEVERKLRRRLESLNKKLGKELAETKTSFLKAVKELESEKKARVILEQVCDELTENIGQDKAQVKDVGPFLRSNNLKENYKHNPLFHRRDGDLAFCQSEARSSGIGEVDDTTDGENSVDSDLRSIGFNGNDPRQIYEMGTPPMTPRNSKKVPIEETKARKSIFNQVARRSTSLLRSVSSIVEWGNGSNHEIDKHVARRSCGDEVPRYKSAKGVRDHTLPSSRFGAEREIASPSNLRGPPWPSRDPCSGGSGMRGRLDEDRVESHESRRSRR
ncbi:hypothetical protein RND81_05G011100 [Saponaria officinalis]|uniref:Uncharacterized protein n=1 Tax=Saponaria officinalis TaxID=3572 RepID=A0AAW1KQ49_SAPOF